jgi:uncharacterized repeat protein (TIGR01451 family)
VDGSSRPKPDISAPGVDIRSSTKDGFYQGGWSGTSMAAPHITGLVALLISAYPNLRGQVDQIEYSIEQSALHIPWMGCSSTGVPNNAYGWGRIDALAAYRNAHLISINKSASADWTNPGDYITYTLTITHAVGISPTTNVVLTDTLPLGTTFVSATLPYTQIGDVIRWDFPNLEPLGTRSVELVVKVDLSAFGPITNSNYAARSDQVAFIRGLPIRTYLAKVLFLPIAIKAP